MPAHLSVTLTISLGGVLRRRLGGCCGSCGGDRGCCWLGGWEQRAATRAWPAPSPIVLCVAHRARGASVRIVAVLAISAMGVPLALKLDVSALGRAVAGIERITPLPASLTIVAVAERVTVEVCAASIVALAASGRGGRFCRGCSLRSSCCCNCGCAKVRRRQQAQQSSVSTPV